MEPWPGRPAWGSQRLQLPLARTATTRLCRSCTTSGRSSGKGSDPSTGGELQQLRQLQHQHLRATGGFPRFIDVGSDVWDRAYDWHVVNGRPLEVTRVGDRYQMPFLHTTLVLRPDAPPAHIGSPTDTR